MQISCENLSVGYGTTEILRGINFEIFKGDFVCIIGENGVGKTTLFKTLLGIQKPLSGEVVYGDGVKESGIGYVPQQLSIQIGFPASVQEVVQSGVKSKGIFYSKQEKELVSSYLKRLGLWGMRYKPFNDLSGGQKQRVLIARALCTTDKILLLDEPTAGLDSPAINGVYALLEDLNKEGITIIMITHDSGFLNHFESKVFKLSKGRLEERHQ
jgi:zinc transport system ATP-binding protein